MGGVYTDNSKGTDAHRRTVLVYGWLLASVRALSRIKGYWGFCRVHSCCQCLFWYYHWSCKLFKSTNTGFSGSTDN